MECIFNKTYIYIHIFILSNAKEHDTHGRVEVDAHTIYIP